MIKILKPAPGEQVSGTYRVIAETTGRWADFYIDDVKKGRDRTSPFTFDWVTTNYADGAHTLSVLSQGESARVAVTVANGVTPPPTPTPSGKLTWAPPDTTGYTHITLADTGQIAPAPYGSSGQPWILTLDPAKDYVLHLGHRRIPAGTFPAGISITGGRNIVMIGGQITGPMQAAASDYNAAAGGKALNQYGIALYQNQGIVHTEGVLIDGFFLSSFYFDQKPYFGGRPNGAIQIQNVRAMCLLMWKESPVYDHSDTFHMVDPVDASNLELRLDRFTGNYDQTGFALYPNPNGGGQFLKSVHLKRVNLRAESLFGSGPGQCAGGDHYAGDYIFHLQPTKAIFDEFWVTLGCHRAEVGVDCPAREPAPRSLINDFFQYDANNSYMAPEYVMSGKPSPGPSVPGDTLTFINPTRDNVWAPDGRSGGVVYCGVPPEGDFCPAGVAGPGYVSPGYA